MNSFISDFCQRCELLLAQKSMTKIELAQKMGIKKQTLNGYFNGDRIPKAEILVKLSEIFNVSIDYLLTGKNFCTKNSYQLNDEEMDAICMYRKLSLYDRTKVNGYLEIATSDKVNHSTTDYVVNDTVEAYNPAPLHSVPVLGLVAAGSPIEAIENVLTFTETELTNIQFALYAKGDSMEPVITDGDIIFVQQRVTLENGEIGICKINNEGTCKIFREYPERIELHSINPNYKPLIYLKKFLNDFQIVGKVILTDEQKKRLSK